MFEYEQKKIDGKMQGGKNRVIFLAPDFWTSDDYNGLVNLIHEIQHVESLTNIRKIGFKGIATERDVLEEELITIPKTIEAIEALYKNKQLPKRKYKQLKKSWQGYLKTKQEEHNSLKGN